MKKALLAPAFWILTSTVLSACGETPEPKTPPAPTVEAPPAVIPPPAVSAAAPKPVEPTAEEKKKAEQREALAHERTEAEAAHKKELARWTPELRAEAKTLTEKTFTDGKSAVRAAMASKTRAPGHADRDKYRHPAETLEFFGLKPGQTVLEYSPGEGWYTELLAPALARKGKLLATNTNPEGPAEERGTLYGQVFKMFLDTSPEAYGKVETVTVDGAAPKLPQEGSVDMVFVARALHGMVNRHTMDAWIAEFNKALKPGGVLAVEQHRAKADATPEESAKMGYLPEKWVIEKIEAAGFKLAGKSEINANPKDTKDYAEGVWTLPPTFRNGEKDHDKYAAIGESDRMTLKFTKIAPTTEKAPPQLPKKP
jgi:predicted methyltransferase